MIVKSFMQMRCTNFICRVGFIALVSLCFAQCIEPFNPAVSSETTDILIVDGFIHAGHAATSIRLSRLTPLASLSQPSPEKKANVNIVSEAGTLFHLNEANDGLYISDTVMLPVNEKYKLRVVLTDDTTYETEFASVKQSPPIDSLTFSVTDRVNIHVHTHDVTNQTRYYRWYFDENWEIHSAYISDYKIENDTIVERPIAEKGPMYRCWQSNQSTGFILGTTRGS
jgi:hypothetical protein